MISLLNKQTELKLIPDDNGYHHFLDGIED
jgi:hypothetical protein